MPRKIIQNEARCNKCDDIIYSRHRHDFVQCKCGAIAVDGGMDYLRRLGHNEDISDRSLRIDSRALDDCVNAVKYADENNRNELGVALSVIRALRSYRLLDETKFA